MLANQAHDWPCLLPVPLLLPLTMHAAMAAACIVVIKYADTGYCCLREMDDAHMSVCGYAVPLKLLLQLYAHTQSCPYSPCT